MFELNHRKLFNIIHLKDVFYAPTRQSKHPGYDAVYYFNCQQPYKNAQEFTTLLVDLTPEPEDILKFFRKETRADIRKALKYNFLHYDISEEPEHQELEEFFHGYDEFALTKGISPCNRDFMERLWSASKLSIATAFMKGQIICQFALIDAMDKAVCYHGYNNRFATKDTDRIKIISQTNRALEYFCMIHAKNKNKKHYDLSGVTLDSHNPTAQKVDQYKMGFRGQVVTEYHYIYPLTLKGKVFCWLKQIKGGI